VNNKHFVFLTLMMFSSLSYGKDYFTTSYNSATGKNYSDMTLQREEDINFIYSDELCCCNDEILRIFKEGTKRQAEKINPATDYLIYGLTMVNEKVDLKINQLKNYKQVNALYSFADRTNSNDRYGDNEPIAPDVPIGGKGCKAMDFNNPEDRAWYESNVIDKYEAKGNYGQAGLSSNAFGRYQFMPSEGASYCAKTTASLGCCEGTWRGFVGAEWRTGANAQVCQDEMFKLLTEDNSGYLEHYRLPQNSCTLYLTHQQGVGGLLWLNGGNLPKGTSLATMRHRVEVNVGKGVWNDALASGVDLNNEDVLRKLYADFWSKKFGGDIFSGEGKAVTVPELTQEAEKFATLSVNRDAFYREGILLELYRQKEEIKSILQNFSTQAISRTSSTPFE